MAPVTTARIVAVHRDTLDFERRPDSVQAVERFGTRDWKAVAQAVGAPRSDSDCYLRWQRVLRHGLVKGPGPRGGRDRHAVRRSRPDGRTSLSVPPRPRIAKQCRGAGQTTSTVAQKAAGRTRRTRSSPPRTRATAARGCASRSSCRTARRTPSRTAGTPRVPPFAAPGRAAARGETTATTRVVRPAIAVRRMWDAIRFAIVGGGDDAAPAASGRARRRGAGGVVGARVRGAVRRARLEGRGSGRAARPGGDCDRDCLRRMRA